MLCIHFVHMQPCVGPKASCPSTTRQADQIRYWWGNSLHSPDPMKVLNYAVCEVTIQNKLCNFYLLFGGSHVKSERAHTIIQHTPHRPDTRHLHLDISSCGFFKLYPNCITEHIITLLLPTFTLNSLLPHAVPNSLTSLSQAAVPALSQAPRDSPLASHHLYYYYYY